MDGNTGRVDAFATQMPPWDWNTSGPVRHSADFLPDVRFRKSDDRTNLLIIASILDEIWMLGSPGNEVAMRAIAVLGIHLLFITEAPEEALLVMAAYINICDHFCITRDASVTLAIVVALMKLGEDPEIIRAIYVALPGYSGGNSDELREHIQRYREQFEEYTWRYAEVIRHTSHGRQASLSGVPKWLATELRRFAATTTKGQCGRVEDFYISVEDGQISFST
jgi:hypothetical protein